MPENPQQKTATPNTAEGHLSPAVLERLGCRHQPFTDFPDAVNDLQRQNQLHVVGYLAQSGEAIQWITGEAGTGKTTLLRALGTLPRGGLRPALVTVSEERPSLTDLWPEAIAQWRLRPSEPGRRSDEHCLKQWDLLIQSGVRPLLLLDDAHRLPAAELQALLSLLAAARNQNHPGVGLIVAAPPTFGTTLGDAVARAGLPVPRRCTLAPLTGEQTVQYLQHRLHSAGVSEERMPDEALLRRIHEQARGCFSDIHREAARMLESSPTARPAPALAGPHRRTAVWTLGAIAALALTTALVLRPGNTPDSGELTADGQRNLSLALPPAPETAPASRSAATAPQPRSKPAPSAVADPAPTAPAATATALAVPDATPKPASAPPETVPEHATDARLPEPLAEAAVPAQATPVSATAPAAPPASVDTAAPAESETRAPETPSPEPETPADRPAPAEQQAAQPETSVHHGVDWVRDQPGAAYTLQLAAMGSEEAARTVARQAPPEITPAIVPVDHDGEQLHVVLYGRFDQREAAEQAAARFTRIQPWIRRFSDLQNRLP